MPVGPRLTPHARAGAFTTDQRRRPLVSEFIMDYLLYLLSLLNLSAIEWGDGLTNA